MNNASPANATGLPDRRLFLAAGPAIAILASLREGAAKESPLVALIEIHRAARQAFCDACDIEQEAERAGVGVKEAGFLWSEKEAAEMDAATALLAYPCRTIEEVRTKVAYVLASPLVNDMRAPEFLDAFLGSFVRGPDACDQA